VDESVVEELMLSIKQCGLLQPIMITPRGGEFEVVFGNHRLAACRKLGWKEMPAIVKQSTDEEMFLLQIVENIQRNVAVNEIEEAKGYKFLMSKGMTIHEIAAAIGKSYQYVWSRMRLLDKLHPYILEALAKRRFRRLNVSHAEQLSMVRDPDKQLELARLVEDQKMSVAGLERIVYADLFPETRTAREESSPLSLWRKGQTYFIGTDRAGIISERTLNIMIDHLGRKSRTIGRIAGHAGRLSILEKAESTVSKTDWALKCFNETTGWGKLSIEGSNLILDDPIVRNTSFLLGYLEGLLSTRLKPLSSPRYPHARFVAEMAFSPYGEWA
jgi:ParB family chromosome partitioning protein